MLLRDGMLDMEGEEIVVVLVQPTILASVFCAFPDYLASARAHFCLRASANLKRTFDLSVAINVEYEM